MNCLNHLHFMDDLKLLAERGPEMEMLIEIVQMCSKNIGIEFDISKCKELTLKRGERRLKGNKMFKQKENRRPG